MKELLTICAFVVAIIGSALFAAGVQKSNTRARATMDNYSFAVGVWCARRVMNPEGWRTNTDVLHDARQFSQTNGWLPFNNHDGFRGDE